MDFLLFAIAHLFAVLSPGPTFIGMTNFSINYGFKKAIPFVCGVALGNMFITLISLFGLSEIIFRFSILKTSFYLISGFYICYFGVKIFKKKPSRNGIQINSKKALWTGFVVESSNPKSIIFTTSLVALVIKPETTFLFSGLILFWLVFVSLIYEIIIIFSFSKFSKKITKYLSLLNKIFGVLLLFLVQGLYFGDWKNFYIR